MLKIFIMTINMREIELYISNGAELVFILFRIYIKLGNKIKTDNTIFVTTVKVLFSLKSFGILIFAL